MKINKMVLNPRASSGLFFPQQAAGNLTKLPVRRSGTRRWIKKIFLLFFCLVLCADASPGCCVTCTGVSQDTTKSQGLFADDKLLELQLVFDFDSVFRDIGQSPSYHKASLAYNNEKGEDVSLHIEVRTRGSFRKDTVNCDFPPLKLRFDREESEHSLFQGMKTIDMVTHCQNEQDEYEQYLLQEYLIYRTYNILTDMSFRVRLLRVTYTDSKMTGRTIRKFAFFIEDRDAMAARNKGKILDISIANPSRINQDQYTLVSFFEYMIINSDWSLPIMHNIEVISTDYFETPYPVPYDFDWSAIINIPYQVPGIGNKANELKVREFKGACRTNKDFHRIIDLYNEKRIDIYQLYLKFKYLDDSYKQLIFKDYNDFYSIINDRERFRSCIRENCDKYTY